jgi:hypothetical protein
MNKAIQAMTTLLILALFTGACSPTVTGQQTDQQIQNTQDPQSIQSDIETAVAQTVEAQNQIATSVAQTVAAQATDTPTPTATLFSLPTVTPFVISTPTIISGNGGGGVPPKAEYSCDVIHQRPYDNQEFLHGQEFDIKWTILNTGTKTWPAGYDLKYLSGPLMTNAGAQELPQMAPGDQFSVVFDAVAPEEPGFHVMTWIVQGQLCYPYIAIIVH